MNEYLIISSVGDNSLHREWIFENKLYDIAVIHYGNGELDTEGLDFFTIKKGFKYPLIKEFINNNIDLIKKYKYIWLPDDDIRIPGESINNLFELASSNDLYLCQPYMSGYCSHSITQKLSNNDVRLTRFVEIVAPLFKLDSLLKVYDTFSENESGWGYDFLWPVLLENSEDKIAILDNIEMIHTRPVGTNYSQFKRNPQYEANDLYYKYGITPGYYPI